MPVSDTAVIFFPGALGDFICFLPALCGLRERHHGTLLLVAKPAQLDLVRLDNMVTASIEGREVTDLFSVGSPLAGATTALLRRFATAYSWTGFGNAQFSGRLAEATGGTVHLFGFHSTRTDEHAADYYLRCIGHPRGASLGPVLVEDPQWFERFAERHRLDARPLLLMHPGSGSTKKNWQGFEAVARHWREHAYGTVVVLLGPAEIDRAMPPIAGAIQVAGLSLPQVVALVRRSSLYVGNDSGISHLAGAAGAQGVVLFGSTDPNAWAPRSTTLQVLHAPQRCRQCETDLLCLHRLPVAPVISALEAQRATGRGEP